MKRLQNLEKLIIKVAKDQKSRLKDKLYKGQ